jgi:hypothetical protein
MDDYVDILIANLKVLASVPTSDWRSEEVNWPTRVSTVSVYYGSGTAIRGNRPSIMSKIRLQVIRTSDDISVYQPGCPKWKDLWNLRAGSRKRQKANSVYKLAFDIFVRMQERLHR